MRRSSGDPSEEQNFPWRFLPGIGFLGAASELFRSTVNYVQLKCSLRVRRARQRATVFLAANTLNAQALAPRRQTPPRVMLEIGIHPPTDPPLRNFRHEGPLRLLWSGVFEHRKALHLLLQALAALPPHAKYELVILGRGPQEHRFRRMAQRLKVESHCRWLGWVNHVQALELFRSADAFVFTSLRDTAGTVVLEALASGIPVLGLDHQGMADIITVDCGVKLPVKRPREVILGLRDTLLRWHDHRDELEQLSVGAIRRAEHFSWDRQGERMIQVYREVLNAAVATKTTCNHVNRLVEASVFDGNAEHTSELGLVSVRGGAPGA